MIDDLKSPPDAPRRMISNLACYSEKSPPTASEVNELKALFPLKPTREILQGLFLDAIRKLREEDPRQDTAYFTYNDDLARAIHALIHSSNSLEVTFLEKISREAPYPDKLIRVMWYNPQSGKGAASVTAVEVTSLVGYTQVSPPWPSPATRGVGERD